MLSLLSKYRSAIVVYLVCVLIISAIAQIGYMIGHGVPHVI